MTSKSNPASSAATASWTRSAGPRCSLSRVYPKATITAVCPAPTKPNTFHGAAWDQRCAVRNDLHARDRARGLAAEHDPSASCNERIDACVRAVGLAVLAGGTGQLVSDLRRQ